MIKVFEPKLSFSDKLAVFSSIMKNEISGSSPIVKNLKKIQPKSLIENMPPLFRMDL